VTTTVAPCTTPALFSQHSWTFTTNPKVDYQQQRGKGLLLPVSPSSTQKRSPSKSKKRRHFMKILVSCCNVIITSFRIFFSKREREKKEKRERGKKKKKKRGSTGTH
jgi:hypothetical protein